MAARPYTVSVGRTMGRSARNTCSAASSAPTASARTGSCTFPGWHHARPLKDPEWVPMGSRRLERRGLMGQRKVRCQYCGAKNTDEKTERCRICGGILPDAAARRKSVTEGANFSALVQKELDTWSVYAEAAVETP